MSKKAFTIETVKWTWADAVKSKEVHRDEQFVRTKTKEEALEAIEFLMGQAAGMTYTITVFRDDEYFTYFRHSMPCLGGLVKYRDSHGETHFMNPYFPRDIRVAYPEGQTIYIACQASQKCFESEYSKFILSEESPWVSAFGTKDTIIFKSSYFVLTNMNTDPTVFYSLMRLAGFNSGGAYGGQGRSFHPKAQILAYKNSLADPRRLAAQKPLRISGGTWAEGFGYTRPYNESIFKTDLPNKLKDFGKLTKGYPNAPYINTYFVKVMKEEFKIDVSTGHPLTEKTEKAFIEAWDYFKKAAEELSDIPQYEAVVKDAEKEEASTVTRKGKKVITKKGKKK